MELAVSIGISPRQPLRAFAEQAGELEAAGVDRLWLIDSQLAMKDVYAGLALAASVATVQGWKIRNVGEKNSQARAGGTISEADRASPAWSTSRRLTIFFIGSDPSGQATQKYASDVKVS